MLGRRILPEPRQRIADQEIREERYDAGRDGARRALGCRLLIAVASYIIVGDDADSPIIYASGRSSSSCLLLIHMRILAVASSLFGVCVGMTHATLSSTACRHI